MYYNYKMKVYTDLSTFHGAKNAVLTTGTFDGVHKGHQSILKKLNALAKASNGESILFTFHPHPRIVLFPDYKDLKLLNTQSEKIELIEKSGIDHLIIYPFNKEFSRLSSLEFVRDILINQLHIKKLVMGYDHQFGRNREGTIENLKELAPLYDFEVEEIPAQMVNEINVSSTKIRNALLEGNLEVAKDFLGYDYPLSGLVISGQQLGRSIGFPTANIKVTDSYKLIPGDGVYAVQVDSGSEKYFGMLNIGHKPTVNSLDTTRGLEVHIFDFDAELYNENIAIRFLKKIRNEEKFPDLDALRKQLEKDKQTVLEIIKSV